MHSLDEQIKLHIEAFCQLTSIRCTRKLIDLQGESDFLKDTKQDAKTRYQEVMNRINEFICPE
jgi:hypothetical protein